MAVRGELFGGLDFEIRTFIHDIPGVALSLVVSNEVGDVVLQNRDQGGIGPRTAGNYDNFSKETFPTTKMKPLPQLGSWLCQTRLWQRSF